MRWRVVWEYVVHMFVGSLLFALLFAVAVGMEAGAAWLKGFANPSDFLISLLTVGKYMLAVVDLTVYFVFLLTMAREFIIKLWWPDHEEAH